VATNVYIDGFNLYYGALKRTHFRWLDLEALCQNLLPNDSIHRIRYFTAKVTARPDDVQAPQRQQTYLRALETLPLVSIHFGHFLTSKTEEKGSDVNIASYMLLDGFNKDYDTAVVISNDSDLCEPVRMVRFELGLTVGVVNPHPAAKRSRVLSQDAHFFKQLRRGALAKSQFPDVLYDARGSFYKPGGW
jgi:uncharacterized LabA/DUF88 family protein